MTQRRVEALHRLQTVQELFGRGDGGQWSRYERICGEATGQMPGSDELITVVVFSAWDSGASSISSGMESTALFTRHEAEKRLSFYRGIVKISLQDWTHEIESLRRALETRRP